MVAVDAGISGAGIDPSGCNNGRGDRNMPEERLTAFSDGVIAIIITIMVPELKVPPSSDW
jgi:Endosomal/lysosomal potassium channel TMEM175